MNKGFGAPEGEQKSSKTLAKELALLAHQKVSVGARHMQSRHVYWVLKVLTFLTPFCKTFLLTNTVEGLASAGTPTCDALLSNLACPIGV